MVQQQNTALKQEKNELSTCHWVCTDKVYTRLYLVYTDMYPFTCDSRLRCSMTGQVCANIQRFDNQPKVRQNSASNESSIPRYTW